MMTKDSLEAILCLADVCDGFAGLSLGLAE
jgi:hypothetical protein